MATLDTTTSGAIGSISATQGDAYFITDTGKLAVYNGSAFNITNYDATAGGFDKVLNHSGVTDGIDDYWNNTSQSSAIDLSTDFTVCGWVNNNKTYGWGGMVAWGGMEGTGKARGIGFTTNKIGYFGYNTAYWGSMTPAIDTWYFVICTVTDALLKVFINGSEEVSQSSPVLNAISTFDGLFIGMLYADATSPGYNDHNGNFSNIGIWNEALSDAECTKLYNGGKACNYDTDSGDYTSSANLVGWWSLDNTLLDLSGEGNHLTAFNGANVNNEGHPPSAL